MHLIGCYHRATDTTRIYAVLRHQLEFHGGILGASQAGEELTSLLGRGSFFLSAFCFDSCMLAFRIGCQFCKLLNPEM